MFRIGATATNIAGLLEIRGIWVQDGFVAQQDGTDPFGVEIDTARITLDEGLSDAVVSGPRDRGVVTVLAGPTPGLLFTLERDRTLIGRGGNVDILIGDNGISRRHAAIVRAPGGYVLEDLGSTNGTTVDGTLVRGQMALRDGARIGLGRESVLGFSLRDQVEHDAARQTHDLAMRDPLTGLYNRRHLGERLDGELAYVQRHGGSITVLMADIDYFKAINDDHGHTVGDHVLRLVAEQLSKVVRREDVLSRYGGEEFLIIARGIDRAGARALGERVREAIAAVGMPVEAERPLTVSVGIAHAAGQAQVVDDSTLLLQLADGALYAAKAAGRNRVELRMAASASPTIRLPSPSLTRGSDGANAESTDAEPAADKAPAER